MQLKLLILSVFGFVLCGLVFVWGMLATFRPDRLRGYEAKITHADRLRIRRAEYKQSLGMAVAGIIAMLVAAGGIVEAVHTCLDQIPLSEIGASLARPHTVTFLQPIVGGCLVLCGVILLVAPSLIFKAFPTSYVAQETPARHRRPSISAKVVSVFPVIVGIWMIVLWLRS